MQKYTVLMWLLLGLLLVSCKDVFYPENITSVEKIPVIQGTIIEGSAPVVTLSWTMNYYDDRTEYISDAIVYITDNKGNQVSLVEQAQKGIYKPVSDDYVGISGATYTLHVITSDGNEFVSSSAKINKRPVVDSLYAIPSTNIVHTYDPYNNLQLDEQVGLFILSDQSADADSTLFYRYNTLVFEESSYATFVDDTTTIFTYMWSYFNLDDIYSVDLTLTNARQQVIREHESGFLEFYYDISLATPIKTAPVVNGWIVIFKAYAITKDVYNYYHSIEEQLNSNNQMFAPVPSKIESNIRCVNNTDQEVTGVFEASSCTNVYKFFKYKGLNGYYSRQLSDFSESIESGSCDTIAPNFWVTY